MCIISATKWLQSSDQESCTAVKKTPWRWRWVSRAKDDPKSSWQRCFSLALISRLTKWPFSLHSDIMESHIMQLISSCRLSSTKTEHNGIFLFCFLFFLKSSWLGESQCRLSPCLSHFFSSLRRLSSKITFIWLQLCNGQRLDNKLARDVTSTWRFLSVTSAE